MNTCIKVIVVRGVVELTVRQNLVRLSYKIETQKSE